MSIDVVTLQSRRVKEYEHFLMTIPKRLVKELGWRKGDRLVIRVVEFEVDGVRRKGLFVYKP